MTTLDAGIAFRVPGTSLVQPRAHCPRCRAHNDRPLKRASQSSRIPVCLTTATSKPESQLVSSFIRKETSANQPGLPVARLLVFSTRSIHTRPTTTSHPVSCPITSIAFASFSSHRRTISADKRAANTVKTAGNTEESSRVEWKEQGRKEETKVAGKKKREGGRRNTSNVQRSERNGRIANGGEEGTTTDAWRCSEGSKRETRRRGATFASRV